MEAVFDTSLTSSFRKGANAETYRRLMRQQKRERRQKEDRLDQGEADMIDLASAIITSEQAELFQTEIDTYQVATVEALEENREAMELVRERLDRILERAHRLEDGRRVFKTEDGLQVFDEFGSEVSNDIISPDEIADDLPRWETARAVMDELERLEAEQTQLLEYQNELDEAQELLDSGEMTQAQFDELRERLATDAPEAVRARVPELGSDIDADAPSIPATPDIDLDVELAAMPMPKPFVPGGA